MVLLIALALGATWAFTDPDRPGKAERKAYADAFAFAGSGYRLGVVLSEISPHLRDDLKIDSGVMIDEVVSDSPAEKAGLKDGDIIVGIDGKKVESERDIRRALRNMQEPGQVAIEIVRDGKPMTLQVKPEKNEINIMTRFGRNHIGVDVRELDADLAKYFQTAPDSGLLITRVNPDSPADRAGLKSGDVITSFEGKKIRSDEDLREAIDDVKEGQTGTISVLRHGKQQKFSVTPEAGSFRSFEVPELGELKELRHLRDLPELRNLPNNPEFRESMQGLRRELQELKNEMEDLKRELRERD